MIGSFDPQRNGFFFGGCGGGVPRVEVTRLSHFWHRHVTAAPTVSHVLLDLLFPRRCVVCSVPGAALCPACATRAAAARRARSAPAAGARPPGRSRAAASARAGGSRSPPRGRPSSTRPACALLVSAWKERGLRGLASLAAALVVEVVPRPSGTAGHVRPARRRPQPRAAGTTRPRGSPASSALLGAAGRAAAAAGRGRSRPQRGLARDERRRNVRGAFRAGPVRGRVVLVDDVYTTGATVSAAATALRAAGACSVDVVTFARAVRR